MSDLADALGWYSVPVPEIAVDAAAELVARLPFVPAEAQWIETLPRAGADGHREGASRAALARRATMRAERSRRWSTPRGPSACFAEANHPYANHLRRLTWRDRTPSHIFAAGRLPAPADVTPGTQTSSRSSARLTKPGVNG